MKIIDSSQLEYEKKDFETCRTLTFGESSLYNYLFVVSFDEQIISLNFKIQAWLRIPWESKTVII